MKLKVDENGNVVLEDGKPVYVRDDGSELKFDAPHAIGKIKELSEERDRYRNEVSPLRDGLKLWTEALGEVTPEEAKQAVELVSSLDDKRLTDAAGVEKIKAEVTVLWEEKLRRKEEALKRQVSDTEQKLEAKESYIREMVIGGRFESTEVLSQTIFGGLPEAAKAMFGGYFEVEPETYGVVGKDYEGNVIMSMDKPGDVAGFDEALTRLIAANPKKDHILVAPLAEGSDSKSETRRTRSPIISKTRSKMSAAEKVAFMTKYGDDAYKSLPLD